MEFHIHMDKFSKNSNIGFISAHIKKTIFILFIKSHGLIYVLLYQNFEKFVCGKEYVNNFKKEKLKK